MPAMPIPSAVTPPARARSGPTGPANSDASETFFAALKATTAAVTAPTAPAAPIMALVSTGWSSIISLTNEIMPVPICTSPRAWGMNSSPMVRLSPSAADWRRVRSPARLSSLMSAMRSAAPAEL